MIAGRDYGGADFDTSVPSWSNVYDTQRSAYATSGSRYSNGLVNRTNQKVKFNLGAGPSGTAAKARGDTDQNETTMTFIRIGDT